MASQTFTALPGNIDPDVMRAVRVITRRDDTVNGPIPTILGRALGVNSIAVTTAAIAEWGFAGSGGLGIGGLPIVIGWWWVAGAGPGDATWAACISFRVSARWSGGVVSSGSLA